MQLVLLFTVSHTIVNPRDHANVGPDMHDNFGYNMGPYKRALVDGPSLLKLCDTV